MNDDDDWIRNPTGIRGRCSPVFHIHCGCAWWHPDGATTRKGAATLARRAGWIFTRALGWMCPECQTEKAGSDSI
jgi:hypothetical protein